MSTGEESPGVEELAERLDALEDRVVLRDELNKDEEPEEVTRREFGKAGVLAALGLGGAAGVGGRQAVKNAVEPAQAAHGGGSIGEEGDPVGAIYAHQFGSSTEPIQTLHADSQTDFTVGTLYADEVNSAEQVTAGRTIQGVHDGLPSAGGVIEVTPSYNPADETLPVSITKPCRVVGPGQTHNFELDYSSNTSNVVFDVYVPSSGSNNYEDSVVIEGFRVRGGDYGLVVDSTQRGFFRDLTFLGQNTGAVDLRASQQAPFSNTFEDVYVEMSADGFTEATAVGAHNTRLRNCKVRGCTGDPVDFNEGKGIWIQGGEYSKNDGRLQIRGGFSVLDGAYIEDNDSANALDVNFQPDAGYIVACRFQGASNNDRAITTNYTSNAHVAYNSFINYVSGFVQVNANSTDCDIHASTNMPLDATPLLTSDGGTRTRSDGVIGGGPLGGVDLSTTTGQYEGDKAMANGTSVAVTYADAVWDPSANSGAGGWQYTDPTGTV